MTRDAIYEKLTVIFRDIFDDEDIEINDNTTARDIEDWDSLEQINLLTAIERKYGLKFSLQDVRGLENIGQMIDLLERLGVQ